MKEKLKNVPHFAWYFIALVFVILVMDIKNLPPEVEKYIFIEDIQKASETAAERNSGTAEEKTETTEEK